MQLRYFLAALLVLSAFIGCATMSGGKRDPASLKLIATTGQIHDALVNLTQGTPTSTKLLCGPGVDPHSFRASTNDVKAMESADAIIFNGFHLEAQLDSILHNRYRQKAWSMASAFPESERLQWKEDGEVDPDAPFDPHIWNDLPGWSESVRALAKKLAEIDPANEKRYLENADAYVSEILETIAGPKRRSPNFRRTERFSSVGTTHLITSRVSTV